MIDREIRSQASAKQTNAQAQRNRTNRWSKVLTDARQLNNKRQFKQQRQQKPQLKKATLY